MEDSKRSVSGEHHWADKEEFSTRSSISNFYRHTTFVSQIEPKSIEEALKDEKWVKAMHEELNQFARNEV